MNEDNVLQMLPLLDRLAAKMRSLLAQEAANRDEWVAIQLDLCQTLAQARDQFPRNIEFGQWCDDNGFDDNVINHQTRAAAIAMGQEPDALRKCLEATKRSSLQTIYENDFSRFTSACKTPRAPSAQNRKAPTAAKVREEVRSLVERGKQVRRSQIAAQFGVSETTVQRVALEERARLKGIYEAKHGDDDTEYYWPPCIPHDLKESKLNRDQRRTVDAIHRYFTDRRSQRLLIVMLEEEWLWMTNKRSSHISTT